MFICFLTNLHVVVLPVVEKEILWSKRCKTPELRGTVKEVIHQISHSKKWVSDIPLTDDNGNVVLRKNGKPKYRASYSILQDELFQYMSDRGFTGFQRGELGSTTENLTSLQYQIMKDKERLSKIEKQIEHEQIKYQPTHNVYKTFNAGTVNEKVALKGLDLTLEDGDFVTVIGGNGAGKSTMLNAVAGVWPVDMGKILIDGQDVTRLSEHQRAKYIGRVFQDPMMGTAATMQIDENLALAARRGLPRTLKVGITKKEHDTYYELLKTLDLGLEERMTSKVGLLSGGQRQAVTLLMATLKKPKLLLLDEHTAALDPKTAAKVLTLSEKIVEENHLTTLMITHNMKDAIKYGNRLIMMYEGHIIYDVRGEEKKNLQVSDLLKRFEQVSDGEFANDRMLLS